MNKPPVTFNRRLFLEASSKYFEKRAVLNPSILEEDGIYHMLYRAVAPENISSIGYLTMNYSSEGIPEVINRAEAPLISAIQDFENNGVEDPRLVKFEENLHVFYTAYDGYHARLAYTTGPDLHSLGEHRLIGPLFTTGEALKMIKDNPKLEVYKKRWEEDPADLFLWEKDAAILPRRVNGKIILIHRLRPDAQIAFLDNLDQLDDPAFWEDHIRNLDKYRLLTQVSNWEDSHMGMGPVPIETEAGWLMIYHGVTHKPAMTYCAGAALFDLNDPQRLIGRTPQPLFVPQEEWEKVGDVNNVVFPEGLVARGNQLDIFYGGADSVIGVISVRLDELLEFLTNI